MSRPELAAFAAALRSEMSRKGAGREAVAAATGVTPQQVSAWRGGHNAPSAKSVAIIEQLLELPRGHLFTLLQDDVEVAAEDVETEDLAGQVADVRRELEDIKRMMQQLLEREQ